MDKAGLTQQFAQFAIHLTRVQISIDDVAVLVQQDHRRQGQDAQLGSKWTIQSAGFVQLGPGHRVFSKVGIEIGTAAVAGPVANRPGMTPDNVNNVLVIRTPPRPSATLSANDCRGTERTYKIGPTLWLDRSTHLGCGSYMVLVIRKLLGFWVLVLVRAGCEAAGEKLASARTS